MKLTTMEVMRRSAMFFNLVAAVFLIGMEILVSYQLDTEDT